MFTIGKEYDFKFHKTFGDTLDNNGVKCAFNIFEFDQYFQKVEPTTTQPMKYKVTITSTDLTGHEDEKQNFKDLRLEQLKNLIELNQSSKIVIEPMPEKQKVTVWFFITTYENGVKYSTSNIEHDTIMQWRNNDISLGRKVSEIKSMEVEI
jgi:hypothetical protein